MKWVGWVVAVAVLAQPPAMAAPPLAFSTSSILVTGLTELQGNLAAAEAFSPHDELAMGWTLELEGRGLIRTETAQVVAADPVIGYQPQQPIHESQPLAGTWRGTQWMNDSFAFIRDVLGRPPPTVSVALLSTRLEVPADVCRQAPGKYIGQTVPDCRDVASATSSIESRGDIELRITGAFQLIVWGWTLENATTHLVTGQTEATGLPDVGPARVHQVNLTTALITNDDGQLILRMDAQGLRGLYIEQVTASTQGLVLLQDATGQASGDVQLEGKSRLAIQPEASRLAVSVLEHEVVEVLPTAVPVPDSTTAGDTGRNWPWVPTMALVAVALAAAIVLYRRRPAVLARISRAIDKGQHDHALKVAQESGLPSGSSNVLQVIALIKGGRLADAELLLKNAKSSFDAAAHHFLLAIVAASRHEDEVARRHLRACFRHDQAYRLEAAMNSHLRRILDLDRPEDAPGPEAYT